MPRNRVYQLRLTDHEKAELFRQAQVKGLSIANLIRTWAGLPTGDSSPRGRPKKKTPTAESMIGAILPKAPSEDQIEAEATRIYNTEGLPMSTALREARKRLS